VRQGEYVSYLAVCPFYVREDSTHTSCDGFGDVVAGVTLRFSGAEAARRFKSDHCRSLRGCSDCPVHQMLRFEIDAATKKET